LRTSSWSHTASEVRSSSTLWRQLTILSFLIVSKKKAGGVPRAGDMPPDGPLLIPGFDLIDVTAVGDDMFALNHDTISSERSVLDDLGRIVITQTRPPHVRTTTLQQMPNKVSPKYWMYPY
jgi:hypothetical protein